MNTALADLILTWWRPLWLLTALPAAHSDWQTRTVARLPALAWGLAGLLLGAAAWIAGDPVPALLMLFSIPVFGWAVRTRRAGLGDLYYGLPVLLDPAAWLLAAAAGLALRRHTGACLPLVSLMWLGLFVLHLAAPLWSA